MLLDCPGCSAPLKESKNFNGVECCKDCHLLASKLDERAALKLAKARMVFRDYITLLLSKGEMHLCPQESIGKSLLKTLK
jgi:hypothetical protein